MANREIGEVIDRIIEEIPEDYESRTVTVDYLNKVKSDAGFTAPECMAGRWTEAARILQFNLPAPGEQEWVAKIALIFSGREP